MRDPKEVQLAWQIVELIQTVADLIWEHYQEDFTEDIKERLRGDEPWTEGLAPILLMDACVYDLRNVRQDVPEGQIA